jgi:adenylate kinase
MKLAISGTPGTGKTVIAKKLSERLGWKLIGLNELARKLGAYQGEDKELDSKILEMRKIYDYWIQVEGDAIIEGHAAHELPADITIVVRCDPKVLEKRLKKRYSKNPKKVEINLNSEILGVITSEAVRYNEKVYEIDTSKRSVEQNVDDIMNILDGRTVEYEVGLMDWLDEYEDRLI